MVFARLEIDADRDGKVEANEDGRWDWNWSPDGRGAIVLPDVDRESNSEPNKELAELRVVLSDGIPDQFDLGLSIDPIAASRVSLFRRLPDGGLQPALGAMAEPEGVPVAFGGPIDKSGETFWLQAHSYPGQGFDGLVEIFLYAVDRTSRKEVVLDRALLRVAPWIMTPNTQPAEQVYVVDLGAGKQGNIKFLSELREACAKAQVPLQVLEGAEVGYDRWIQDEIEFGYSQGARHVIQVICDGPRNRELDVAAERFLAGPDLGVVELRTHFGDRDSLDSFGNLEVSPPVTVAGTSYPLGRIVLGTKRPKPSTQGDRKAALALRQFLYAQLVQAPFEVHTDWLAVGHIDEILNFVPSAEAGGFRALIASPRSAHDLFKSWRDEGHGDLVLWEGQERILASGEHVPAQETIDDLLGKKELWEFNDRCQAILDELQEDLVANLGLQTKDLIRIPTVFKDLDGYALAYFPDMVNHLVLGNISIVPRPYGPKLDNEDLLEKAFRDAVPEQEAIFIDDWLSYHEQMGEVHCGTNVRRKPMSDVRWWEHRLPGMWDASAGRRAP